MAGGDGDDGGNGGNGGNGGSAPATGDASLLPVELRALLSPEATRLTESLFEAQLDRNLTLKAIFEASKKSSEENIQSLQNEMIKMKNAVDEYRFKLQTSEEKVQETEKQLEFSRSELRDAQESLAIQKVSCENFRLQRDSATEVRNSLSNMIETRNTEIDCLKSTIENLKSQLETAVEVRCDALTKNKLIESKTISLNMKDKYLEQEKIGQNGQIEVLKNELQRCSNDLYGVKANLTTMKVNFERQLGQKVDQLNVAHAKIRKMLETKTALTNKIEDLNQILTEQQEKESKLIEDHKNEMMTNTKLIELYKSAQEDSNKKNEELTKTIQELNKYQNESTEKYEELQNKLYTVEAEYKEIIEERNECVNVLKRELEHANDLLQMTDNDLLSSTMDDLSPSAAIASKLIRSKMSLTQAYDQLLKLSDDLAVEKNENKRLSHALSSIVGELEEKTPLIEQQKLEYEETLEKNSLLAQQLEAFILESNGLKEEKLDIEKHFKVIQKENIKLKAELNDLSNQVCVLLKETGMSKGILYNSEIDDEHLVNGPQNLNSSQIISKCLVTFRDVNELQSNNQKLLRLVRDLSEKQEENEQLGGQVDNKELEAKLSILEGRIGELTAAQDRQIKMINKLVDQRDKYKKQCNENSKAQSMNYSFNTELSDNSIDMNATSKSTTFMMDSKKLQYLELIETQLTDVKSELNKEREKYRSYVEKANKNEIKLMESNEMIYKQFTELQTKYSKCLSSSESINERVKVLQMELSTYKEEIFSLNQKIGTYTSLTGKQESSIKKICDDLSSSRSKLSNAETLINSLQMEYSALKNTSKAAPVADQLHESCSFALKNIEIIKNNILDGNNESIIKLQSTLEEANRTCTSLRCILQEEQDKYHHITTQLYQEIEELKKQIENEKVVSNNFQQELIDSKQEIENKKACIEELNKKISFNSFNTMGDNFDLTDIKSKEKELHDYKNQINTLQQQLEISKKYIEKYSNIYECSEKELKNIHQSFNEYKTVTEEKMTRILESERELKEKCENFEKELHIRSDELTISQNKINTLSLELTDKNNNLNKVESELSKLSENAQLTEEKYAHEIILHSNDIQALAQLKSQLSISNQNINNMKHAKLELECALKENKINWENHKQMLISENEDIKKQILDLTSQNSLLHDQIQALSNKLSSINGSESKHSDSSNMDSSINTSVTDDDVKSSEQLLNIVKYLRKERDVLIAKFDILRAENLRIKNQLETTEALLDESKLTSTSNQTDVDPLSIKQSGVLRKVEELNAISDCYANLRKERDGLLNQISELSQNYKSLQETLAPTQSNICELTVKVEFLQSENGNLKEEVDLWKNRVNTLIEKGDHDYPDDWKKIQTEHEALSKSLSTEKENFKKINEEAKKLKSDNELLEKQIEKLNRQNAIITDNLKKQVADLSNYKQEIEKINQELSQTKVMVQEKVKENTVINEKLASNEAILTDTRMKELQIRKIAKNYKTQYQELLKSMEEEKKKSETLVSEAALSTENHLETCKELEKKTLDLEKNHSEKLTELSNKITSYSEENTKLKSEIETLRTSNQEMEDKAKQLLKQAKAKIVFLTESKETLTKELNESKSKVDLFEQNKDENDVRLQVIKSQYDGRVTKLEKEKTQLLQEKQSEIAQLNKQIEALLMKMSQMQRKVDNHQPPKPSTSSNPGEKSITDPPTANIKPMAGVAAPREVNRRTAGETPLASIRPMASHFGFRTAAVLPTAQTPIHHQTPHTTGSSASDSALSSSSGLLNITEYMPSSSSVTPRVHPSLSRVVSLPPAESTQDIDGESVADTEMAAGTSTPAPPQSVNLCQHSPQQGVALVMPRMETVAEPQTSHGYQQQASSSSSGSSSTVTTSHGQNVGANSGKSEIPRAFKRPRVTSAQPQQKTILKRTKTQIPESDIEYQLPTSSQRDQEDDVNFSDMIDDETYQDRIYGVEDDADEEKDRQSIEARSAEESSDSGNQENSRSNETESNSNTSQGVQNARIDEGRSGNNNLDSVDRGTIPPATPLQEQQIETISSGNGIDSGFLVIGGSNTSGVTSGIVPGAYEDVDDSIVPSTPTLYVPIRNDGFGEAVRSPMTSRGLVSNEGRFTFNENNTGGTMEDTHPDLAPQLTPQNRSTSENPAVLETSEAEVGGSTLDTNPVDDETSSVSSHGVANVPPQAQVEEGREAEASTTAGTNTPTRVTWPGIRGAKPIRRATSVHVHTPRPTDHQRPSPIVWGTEGNFRRGSFNQQRGQRGNRHPIRRPSTYFKHF